MFSHSTFLLWILVTCFKAAIFARTFRGGYTYFRAYIGWSLVKSLTLWGCALGNQSIAYRNVYYAGGLVENGLLLASLLEIGALFFWPFVILPKGILRAGLLASIFCIVGLILNAAFFLNGLHFHTLRVADRVSCTALLLCVVFLVGFARHLRIPWRSRASWIVLGFVIYLSIETASAYASPKFWVSAAAYLLAEASWLLGFILPETELGHHSLEDLQAFHSVAETILPPKKPVSVEVGRTVVRKGVVA